MKKGAAAVFLLLQQRLHGARISSCWIKSRMKQSGYGIFRNAGKTAGREMFLSTKSKQTFFARQVLSDKVSDFPAKFPSPQSELAVQMMKEPFVFDFIPFRVDMQERFMRICPDEAGTWKRIVIKYQCDRYPKD